MTTNTGCYRQSGQGDDSPLPRIWLQSAVLGALWASSEIILGSFFHALHLPLRSMILAAIGVALMVAVGRRWSARGLFWRAGLICALMKSLSPAGLILSPMVAILAQGFMMELGTRSLGRNFSGFLTGGILALCWNLLQLLGFYVILYGWNIVLIYQKIYQLSSSIVHLPTGHYWLPVYIALGAHVVLGATAAMIGYALSAGKSREDYAGASMKTNEVKALMQRVQQPTPRSLWMLILNLLFFCAFFVTLFLVRFPYNVLLVLPLPVFWIIRYRQSLNVLRKPLFWIIFLLLTLLSALLIQQAQQPGVFSPDGLWAGLLMNFRAVNLLIGLSVIGYELSNPAIRDMLRGKRAQYLLLSLEAASKALPVIISNLPPAKDCLKRPRFLFVYLVHRTEHWLRELEVAQTPHPGLVLLSGAVHEGKTTRLLEVVDLLKNSGYSVGGFYSRAVLEGGARTGYDICDFSRTICQTLSRRKGQGLWRIGDYEVTEEGYRTGQQLLQQAALNPTGLCVIDEIGPWELAGNGWASNLPELLENRVPMIWVVRKSILEAVVAKWNLQQPLVLEVSVDSAQQAVQKILAYHATILTAEAD